MKNELDIIIDEFQREQDYLQSSLEDCIAEWDFKFAAHFKTSYAFTRDALRVLKNFQNSNFDKMEELAGRIHYHQQLIKKNKDNQDFMKYFVNRIPAYEAELEALKQTKPKWRVDGDTLITALESLLENKIKALEIVLDEKRNGKLILFLSGPLLKMQLIYGMEFTYDQYLGKGELTKLGKIGFDVERVPLELALEKPKYQQVSYIMEPIARVCFDVFRLYGDKKVELICENC